ncbi:DUF5063 domain-containing protein [Flavobacterium alvei]|mgnify:CR=1 FL=1|uniref:DUF5063 domain-containing protein n=1 Tax=Flavobacterium alvei TaxID=2080416 RepID=UPI0026ED8529|nr:DUF5063 domain-containing protein [Flavobacterium alvei]
MEELLSTIDEIVKFGLFPKLKDENKNELLEKNLIKIYSLYFEVNYNFDENNYEEFDIKKFPNIRQNVESNFENFGFYKMLLDINDFENKIENTLGDAVDDLLDIIKDLLEVKWRIENNSLDDGIWFFKFIFKSHTQQHILDLLNYIKQKEE